MADDQLFRWILVAGFVVLLPVMAYHRIRSQATKESLDRRQEGPFILWTLRPLGLLRMLGVVAFMVNPAWMRWSSLPLPTGLRWSGVAVAVLGGGLIVWTFRTLGPNLTDTVVTRRDHFLVTDGPYRWVRHPFYVGFLVVIVADSIVVANWYLAATGLATFSLMVLRTRIEEKKLVERFGKAYEEYMCRTGRFWPRLRQV